MTSRPVGTLASETQAAVVPFGVPSNRATERLSRSDELLRSEPLQVVEERVAKLRFGRRVSLGVGLLTAALTAFVNLRVTWGTVNSAVEGAIGPCSILLALFLIEFCPTYRSWSSRLVLVVTAGAIALGFALSYEHFLELIEAESVGAYAGAATPDVLAGVALFKSLEMRSKGARDLAELDRRRVAQAAAEADAELAAELQAEERRRVERLAELRVARAGELRAAWEERREARVAEARSAQLALAAERAKQPRSPGGKTTRQQVETDALIAAHLAEHPEATQAAIAKALGVGPKTIQRSAVWAEEYARRKGLAGGGEVVGSAESNGSGEGSVA